MHVLTGIADTLALPVLLRESDRHLRKRAKQMKL